MEKKIDFYKMKRELHYKMVDAITALLKTHGLTEFDLLESDADHAFIIVSTDGAESTQEIEVQKVFLKDGALFANSYTVLWLTSMRLCMTIWSISTEPCTPVKEMEKVIFQTA